MYPQETRGAALLKKTGTLNDMFHTHTTNMVAAQDRSSTKSKGKDAETNRNDKLVYFSNYVNYEESK